MLAEVILQLALWLRRAARPSRKATDQFVDLLDFTPAARSARCRRSSKQPTPRPTLNFCIRDATGCRNAREAALSAECSSHAEAKLFSARCPDAWKGEARSERNARIERSCAPGGALTGGRLRLVEEAVERRVVEAGRPYFTPHAA